MKKTCRWYWRSSVFLTEREITESRESNREIARERQRDRARDKREEERERKKKMTTMMVNNNTTIKRDEEEREREKETERKRETVQQRSGQCTFSLFLLFFLSPALSLSLSASPSSLCLFYMLRAVFPRRNDIGCSHRMQNVVRTEAIRYAKKIQEANKKKRD